MRKLASRLRERRDEIAAAILTRAHAVADPAQVEDPEYATGLREAVRAGLDYAIEGIESGQPQLPPPPPQLIAQARTAARNGVSLDTVLRRYSAGYSLLGDFVIEEANSCGVPAPELRSALRAQAAVYDGLVVAISREHSLETEARRHGRADPRSADLVRMLLAGDPVDPGALRYSFGGWHLAMVASGPCALDGLRSLAAALDREHLAIRTPEEGVWAWLGGRSPIPSRMVLELAENHLPEGAPLALGEPGQGVEGWRLSHRQARAAMSVLSRAPGNRVSYAEVALLASALRDDVLANSLRAIYIAPLEAERDGGSTLRETLHAYFAVGRNVSSAAAKLGIARQTVSIRLRTAEERIGRSLDSCAAEAEVALRLKQLDGVATGR